MVAERIRARLYRTEGIVAIVVGDHPAAAAKIGINRRHVSVVPVAVPAAGVGLPYLDQRAGHTTAVPVEHATMHDRPFADRLA